MKKFNNNFTTPKQSMRLLELGMPANSADCFYDHFGYKNIRDCELELESNFFDNSIQKYYDKYEGVIPCWSVVRLIEVYDTCIPDNGDWPNYFKYGNLLEYVIDCIDVAIEKELIDFSKLEE